MARLTDEQLAEWAAKQAGTQSGDVLAELLAARKVVEAARTLWEAHEYDYSCEGKHLTYLAKALTALDKATNAAAPQE